jgi:hypothetical protein
MSLLSNVNEVSSSRSLKSEEFNSTTKIEEIKSDINHQFKIQIFSNLSTMNNINQIENWSEYVQKLNRGNPNYISADHEKNNKNCKSKRFDCYICGNSFIENDKDKFGNPTCYHVDFLYKPHKNNWRKEKLCTACYYVLQNPKFNFEDQDSNYGYPGRLDNYQYIPARYLDDGKYFDIPENNQGYYFQDAKDKNDYEDYSYD